MKGCSFTGSQDRLPDTTGYHFWQIAQVVDIRIFGYYRNIIVDKPVLEGIAVKQEDKRGKNSESEVILI